MKEQFHSKIHTLIQQSTDGQLTPSQQQTLDAHLAGCAECRLYAAELQALETQLASVSVTRLVPPASQQAALTAAIHKRYRRYQMNKQILSFAGTLVALTAVAVLIVLFGHFVPRLSSPAAAPTATEANEISSTTVPTATSTTQNQPLRYFIHAESDTRPVETQVPGVNTTPDASQSIAPNLSIAEAAQQAGFDVLAPTWLPDFLVLEGASYWPKQHVFEVIYGVAPNDPNENNLALMEQPIPENGGDCISNYSIACNSLVGASATIEEVQIGDIPAEYVANGVWQAIDDSGQWGWDATPPIQKLRWHANGVAFELSTIIDGFSKKDLITIAERLMAVSMIMETPTQNLPLRFFTRAESDVLPLQPWQLTRSPETPTPDPGFISNLTISETERLAGFDVLEPIGFPDLLYFNGASLDPRLNIVRLFYRAGFVLREERIKTNDDCELCGVVGASAVVKTVQINDVIGEYVVGVWNLTDNGPIWETTRFLKTLRWQANGMAFELMYNPTHDPETVTMADMIAIAESLR